MDCVNNIINRVGFVASKIKIKVSVVLVLVLICHKIRYRILQHSMIGLGM